MNARASWNDGTGTNRFLLRQPTLFSTLPFSLPEQGLAKAWSSPQRAAKRRKGPDVLASPPTRPPTSAALSKAALPGTPPTNPRTLRGPWQTHSAVSPRKTWVSPTLECGKVTVRYLPLVTTPRTLESASPKSTWTSPGGHLGVRNPSASLRSRSRAISSRRRLAWRRAVGRLPAWPSSSRSLT